MTKTIDWDSLVAENSKLVKGIAYRYVRNVEAAEDLSQDVFMKVFTNIERFDEAKGTFHNWIITMAHRVCIDSHRKSIRVKTTSLDSMVGFEVGIEDSAEAKMILIEAKSKMNAELGLIAEGFTYAEVAQKLNVNVGTVKSRVNRNRVELNVA